MAYYAASSPPPPKAPSLAPTTNSELTSPPLPPPPVEEKKKKGLAKRILSACCSLFRFQTRLLTCDRQRQRSLLEEEAIMSRSRARRLWSVSFRRLVHSPLPFSYTAAVPPLSRDLPPPRRNPTCVDHVCANVCLFASFPFLWGFVEAVRQRRGRRQAHGSQIASFSLNNLVKVSPLLRPPIPTVRPSLLSFPRLKPYTISTISRRRRPSIPH